MTHMIQCAKLKKLAEGLERPPFPGVLGQKVYTEISAEAWQAWLSHQTMLINEFRLNVVDSKARAFLSDEMQKFLFGDGSEAPAGYVPPEKK
ncbi:MAG: oxidative damage protection protein [Gammaproteobacteria bacterium]|nr:oxidative damage protection protein [Gammaproteobacteria bacterium]